MSIRSSRLLDSLGNPVNYNSSDEADLSSLAWNTTHSMKYAASQETVGPMGLYAFEYTQPFSLMIWYKSWNEASAAYQILLSNFGAAPNYRGYGFRLNNVGQLEFFLSNALTGTPYRVDVAGTTDLRPLATGWKFVASTYTGSGLASGVKLYINGVLETMTTVGDNLGGRTIVLADQFFTIGNNIKSDQFSSGYLCEASVSTKELSAAELLLMYGSGKPTNPRKFATSMQLVSHWRLSEDGAEFPLSKPEIGEHWAYHYGMTKAAVILDAP